MSKEDTNPISQFWEFETSSQNGSRWNHILREQPVKVAGKENFNEDLRSSVIGKSWNGASRGCSRKCRRGEQWEVDSCTKNSRRSLKERLEKRISMGCPNLAQWLWLAGILTGLQECQKHWALAGPWSASHLAWIDRFQRKMSSQEHRETCL